MAGVRITHPDRMLYPDCGVTKVDLARYYESIADLILPQIAGRPITLVRCPQGLGARISPSIRFRRTSSGVLPPGCFFQKHESRSMPPGIRRVPIRERAGTGLYLAVEDIEGLVSLIQLGALELHPWGARIDRLESPDRMVFDFDPGEGVGWNEVVDAAIDVRERLSRLGLASFAKTTGGKGVHVVVPLMRRNTWDEVKDFSRAVADSMVRRAPDRYVATMALAKRPGKIFVDYLRNARGATAVAPFSSRARGGAPVAVPVRWGDLERGKVEPAAFSVANAAKWSADQRIVEAWRDLDGARQCITAAMQRQARSD